MEAMMTQSAPPDESKNEGDNWRECDDLRRVLRIPYRRLAALDDALFNDESSLAKTLGQRILSKNVGSNKLFNDISDLCIANDLLFASDYVVAAFCKRDHFDKEIFGLRAKTLLALGKFEEAWHFFEKAEQIMQPDNDVLLLAMRLGKFAYVADMLKSDRIKKRFRDYLPIFLYHSLSDRIESNSHRVYVINLPSDRYRRLRAEASMRLIHNDAVFRRGYRPGEIPEESLNLFRVRVQKASDGSFGNQYAQYRVWKEIGNSSDWALILEDDSQLLLPPDAALSSVALPSEWDIVFANPRMNFGGFRGNNQAVFSLEPFADVFGWLSYKHPGWLGFGADCYFLSRAGANKLVRIAETEGFHTIGTDWWIQAHCMKAMDYKDFNNESRILQEMRRRHQATERHSSLLLNAYVLSPAISLNYSVGLSRSSRI